MDQLAVVTADAQPFNLLPLLLAACCFIVVATVVGVIVLVVRKTRDPK
jgi:tetrahydromethanopterin S-methyltransferase subunit C